jgi:hypothetical protein
MWQRAKRLMIVAVIAWFGSVAIAGTASAVTPSARTNLLANGSFERPRLGSSEPSRQFFTGDRLGAWTVTVGSVFTTTENGVFETPPVGLQAVNLRSSPDINDGEICQPVTGMVPGAEYKVRLLAGSVIEESAIDVTLGGVDVGHLDIAGHVPAIFKLYVWRVTAAASDASFCLHGHPIGAYGFPIVDAVRIKPVPAPSV